MSTDRIIQQRALVLVRLVTKCQQWCSPSRRERMAYIGQHASNELAPGDGKGEIDNRSTSPPWNELERIRGVL